MNERNIVYSVFTKRWKMPLPELGDFVHGLGFDGIEFPVRPGYQVEPQKVADLPKAARVLAEHGVKITSVAGPTDEATIAACAEAGVPAIRICVGIGDDGYMATEQRLRSKYDALVPLLDKYGMTLGIQNHCDRCVCNAMGLRHLIERYDPRHIAAIWCGAHNALNGEDPELAIDIIWSYLCQVKFKNAFWRRTTGPEAEHVQWRPYWTSGRQGLASWPRIVAELKRRDYKGVVCLDAEYSDHDGTQRLVVEDLAFVKSLFAQEENPQ